MGGSNNVVFDLVELTVFVGEGNITTAQSDAVTALMSSSEVKCV